MLSNYMLNVIKRHFSKSYNLVFWLLFSPAMIWTLTAVYELYTKYYNELSSQDHMQFFLRFFFPISLATLVTVLERRQRLRRGSLVGKIKNYLDN